MMERSDVIVNLSIAPEVVRGSFDAACQLITKSVSHVIDVERVSVWLLSEDRRTLHCECLYERSLDRYSKADDLCAQDNPRYFSAITTSRALLVGDVHANDRTFELIENYLEPANIGAMLDSGIRCNGAIAGILCVEHVGGPRAWSVEDLAFATSAADQIVITLCNRDVNRALVVADAARDSKHEFLRNLSHELRTPLTGMLGWLEMLSDSQTSEPSLEKVCSHAKKLGSIIDSVLNLANSSEETLIELSRETLDFRLILSGALKSVKPTLDAKNIVLSYSGDAFPCMVSADQKRMHRAVAEVLENAAKFSDNAGSIEISLRSCGDHVALKIKDHGEGIASEFLPSVFDVFRQEDASLTRRHGGMGIGLSVARAIVAAHGGSVRICSSGKGYGTEVFLTLPIDRPESSQKTSLLNH